MPLMGRGVGYSYGMSQLAITVGVIMFFPPASVQLFVRTPCVVNGTLARGCGSTQGHRLWLLTPCLLTSGLTAGFASSTFALSEAGALDERTAYTREAMHETGLWNAMFWAVHALAHAIVVMAACTPCDLFAALGATYLMVHFMYRICQPQEGGGEPGVHPGAFWSPMTANGNLLGYSAGMGIAFYCVPENYGNRFTLLFLMGILDYFLGIGHVWDREPSTATIANCRLMWICSASLCLSALYGVWTNDLLMPSAGGRGLE